MDRVILLMLGVLAVAPCACSATTVAEPAATPVDRLERWREFVSEASRRFGISEAWIYAVMESESRGETMLDGRPITSRAGAIGLMQVMPDTYEEMREAHDLGPDPHDPKDNILAGAAYLRTMYDRFGFPGLFAAYNAGPGRYEEHLLHGRPLPKETISYLKTLDEAGLSAGDMDEIAGNSARSRKPAPSSGRSLFFLRDGVPEAASAGRILVPLGADRAGRPRQDRR